jgi:opacity protein-like surface antigen
MIIRKLAVAGVIATGLGGASTANAQWDGFYVDGGLGAGALSASVSTNIAGETASLDAGKTSFAFQLGAGWRKDFGNWVLGLGAFWDPFSSTISELSATDSTGTGTAKIQQKWRWGLGVDAGWNPTNNTVIYGKVTYSWANVETKADANFFNGTAASGSHSNTHTGWGLGAGARYLVTNNAYVFAEWQWYDLNKKTWTPVTGTSVDVQPSGNLGLIGVGWKF